MFDDMDTHQDLIGLYARMTYTMMSYKIMHNKSFSSMLKEFPCRISFVFEQAVDTGGFVEIFIPHFGILHTVCEAL